MNGSDSIDGDLWLEYQENMFLSSFIKKNQFDKLKSVVEMV